VASYSKNEAKEYAKEHLRGVFSAFCLPETEDGAIDEAGLRHDVRHYVDVIKAGGLYVHGFYGNFWLLTVPERKRAMEIVSDEAKGRLPIVCRCAHQSLRDTLDLIAHAEANGADIISLVGPAFGGGNESMVIEYFERVAAATNLGISIFNTPQAGYVISPQLMARLADIPNVAALKNGIREPGHTDRVRELVGDRIVVVDPYEETFLTSLIQHGQKVIYTGTNYMYDSARATPMRDYVVAALDGDFALATERYEAMQPIRDLHQTWVLDPWRGQHLCPVATIKYWSSELGLTGGPVRPPLPTFPAEEAAQLKAGMREVGLLAADA
jgi:4-hydroxy-tetrahydrodipicolinate synthase